MKISLLLLSTLLFFANTLAAQQAQLSVSPEKPPLPKPILHWAPELAQWTVTFDETPSTRGAPSPLPAAQPATMAADPNKRAEKKLPHKLIVIKSGKIFLEVETEADGKRWEKWNVNGRQVSFLTGTDKWIITEGGAPGTFFTNYAQHDFPDFAWISAKNYVAFAKVFNADCFIFRDQIMLPEHSTPISVTAAIDKSTQLPVYLDQGGVKRIYKFEPPPQMLLAVPARVQGILAEQEKAVAPLLRRPGQL